MRSTRARPGTVRAWRLGHLVQRAGQRGQLDHLVPCVRPGRVEAGLSWPGRVEVVERVEVAERGLAGAELS